MIRLAVAMSLALLAGATLLALGLLPFLPNARGVVVLALASVLLVALGHVFLPTLRRRAPEATAAWLTRREPKRPPLARLKRSPPCPTRTMRARKSPSPER